MNSLAAITSKLQNVLHTVGNEAFMLPQIVVVGDQSSGKSSIIESILEKSFLPKGVGIVTRRPLILQLNNITKDDKFPVDEFGVFQHKKNVVFHDFKEIRMEIEAETRNRVGTNKEISEEPIHLSIYTKNLPNLTFIDLPGMIKVPVGNQPPDIDMRVRKLVTRYISNPNAIILAVVTANTDMVTSESLKLAKEFDREGNRTLAVVTKLDLMDSGTDAMDILSGRVIPIKLGIIGVVNRSQKDALANKPMADTIRDEAAFLQEHYPSIASKHGTPYLTQTLNRILKHHIKKCLPDLKLRVSNVKAQTLDRLQYFGEDVADSSKALLHVITMFSSTYCSALDGTSRQIDTTKLSGGARICYIFHETFGKALDHIQPLIGVSKYDILTVMRNSSGTRPALFVPEVCFETLVRKQIARLLEPSLRCVELIHDEMQQILQNTWTDARQEVIRFPKLFDKIIILASEIIRRRLTETNAMVENLIDIELAYINTVHPEFRQSTDVAIFYSDKRRRQREKNDAGIELQESSNSSSPSRICVNRSGIVPSNSILSLGWFTSFIPVNYISKIPRNIIAHNVTDHLNSSGSIKSQTTTFTPIQPLTERDKDECEAIEKLVSSYFNIIKKSIQDKVPKVIMHCLVNFVKENLQRELVEALYKPEQDFTLLEEPEQIKVQREEQRYILKTLDDIDVMLNEIRDSLT